MLTAIINELVEVGSSTVTVNIVLINTKKN